VYEQWETHPPPNHVRCASTGQQAVSQNKPEQKQTEEGTNI